MFFFGNRSMSSCKWTDLYCACAETAIAELPVKILTPPLHSANQIFYMVRIFWRSVVIYHILLFFSLVILSYIIYLTFNVAKINK